jgi:hypothetical protein
MATEESNKQPTPSNQTIATREIKAFGAETVERSSELASVAVAASARAEVESSYVMAMKNPRHEETARTMILASCRNPGFALKARFRKPMGSKEVNGRWEPQFVVGPSIRFAEEMLRCWKNVLVQQNAIYDDAVKRIVRVTVRDLESNTAYSKEITLEKTVERHNAKDREVLGRRINSSNKEVFIVRTTEDELNIKEAALASKVIRNNGLRLIPQHIQDEAMLEVEKVIRDKAAKDPEGERRAILDGFAKRGITPLEIERYMGGPSAQFTSDDLLRLREMLTSIEDGHSSWQEFIDGTSSQTTGEIAEKSQVETKGAAINEKLKDIAKERGVETTAQNAPAAQAQQVLDKTSDAIPQATTNQSATGSSTAQQAGQVDVSTNAAMNSQDAMTSDAATTPESIKQAVDAAERFLKSTPIGSKKYHSILSAMKVRLTGKQQPLDVIPVSQHTFYLAQLVGVIDQLKKG